MSWKGWGSTIYSKCSSGIFTAVLCRIDSLTMFRIRLVLTSILPRPRPMRFLLWDDSFSLLVPGHTRRVNIYNARRAPFLTSILDVGGNNLKRSIYFTLLIVIYTMNHWSKWYNSIWISHKLGFICTCTDQTFIYGLFSDVLCSSNYTEWSVNNESEWMWKEAYFVSGKPISRSESGILGVRSMVTNHSVKMLGNMHQNEYASQRVV
jgi:hypothetical protein